MDLNVREDASGNVRNNSDVRVNKRSPRSDRFSTANSADGDSICAVKTSITAKENLIMMRRFIVAMKHTFIVAKLFVYLAFIAYATLPVYAVTNLKGDIRVEVEVPEEAVLGNYADLRCNWSIVGEKHLYSVKWYKDDHEFFRFVPTNQPTIQTFPQQGVKLEKKAIGEKSIRLKDFTLNSTGQYKCEVSTEGPSFATEYKTGNLTVIVLPKQGPKILGLSSHYAVGENVTANCTASPSVPKAKLHWLINGKQVPKEYVVVHPPEKSNATLGLPNSLGLRMNADQRHFEGRDGSVSIHCVSVVGKKRQEVEKTVHMAHVNNQRLSAGDHLRAGGTAIKMTQSSHERCLAVILLVVSFCAAT